MEDDWLPYMNLVSSARQAPNIPLTIPSDVLRNRIKQRNISDEEELPDKEEPLQGMQIHARPCGIYSSDTVHSRL